MRQERMDVRPRQTNARLIENLNPAIGNGWRSAIGLPLQVCCNWIGGGVRPSHRGRLALHAYVTMSEIGNATGRRYWRRLIFLGLLVVLVSGVTLRAFAFQGDVSEPCMQRTRIARSVGSGARGGYNPHVTKLSRAARLSAYHTSKFVFQRLSIPLVVFIIFQVLLRLLGEIQPKKMWLWILVAIGAYWIVALVIFAVNTVRGLAGKLPRKLSRRQRRKIIEHLKSYPSDGRIVNVKVCYQQDRDSEKEAHNYADDIITAIQQAGWRVNWEGQGCYDEPEHSSGLWVYGQNPKGLGQPLTREIVATAFKRAGVEVDEDRETVIGWTFIVVGHGGKGLAR